MVNNSHRQSFLSPMESDPNLIAMTLGSSRPSTAPGHHLRMIRTLSQSSHPSDEPSSTLKSIPGPLTRALSGLKSSSGFKKHKFTKSQSRSELDSKDKQLKIIPHFGNRRIASCLIKLAQARLLISDDVPAHLEYHSAALHDAESVHPSSHPTFPLLLSISLSTRPFKLSLQTSASLWSVSSVIFVSLDMIKLLHSSTLS
jgi:hypothetical protein